MPLVAGANGTWEHTVTAGAPGPPKQGDRIDISFTPNAGVACADVRLTQAVWIRALDSTGAVVAREEAELWTNPATSPFTHTRGDCVLRRDRDGYYKVWIDHLACEGDPYYNGDDVPQDAASPGRAGTPTRMDDRPSLPLGGNMRPEIATIEAHFETCAICTETGECLGCLHWSTTATASDRGTITVHTTNKDKPCSPMIDAALKQFARRHVAGRDATGRLHWYCPEGDDLKPTRVPEDAERRWTLKGLVTFAEANPRRASKPPTVKRVQLPRAAAPAQVPTTSLDEVLALCYQTPRAAALKLTWSGEQTKTVPGVIFSVRRKLDLERLAALTPGEERFANDFDALLHRAVSSRAFMSLLEGVPREPAEEGPVTLALIAGLTSQRPRVHIAGLSRERVGELLRTAAPGVDRPTRAVLRYLALNLGDEAAG